MEYSKVYNDIISVLKLEKSGFERVAKNKKSTIIGVILLLGPPVINLVLAGFTFPSGFGVIFSRFMLWPMFVPALAVGGAVYVMSFVARRYFGAKGSGFEFVRPVLYASAVLWVSIIPFLLAFISNFDAFGIYNLIWFVGVVWIFVVAYKMLQSHHRLNDKNAGTVVALGIVGYLVFKWFLGLVLVGNTFRFWF